MADIALTTFYLSVTVLSAALAGIFVTLFVFLVRHVWREW